MSTTVATIIKVLSLVHIEYSARRRRSMTPTNQAPRSSPGMILKLHRPTTRSGWESRQYEMKAREWQC